MLKIRLLLAVMASCFVLLFSNLNAQSVGKAQAVQHFQNHLEEFELEASDLAEIEITDQHTDERTGATHIYIRQLHNGIPLRQGVGSVHLKKGKVYHETSNLIGNIQEKVANNPIALSREQAIQAAARELDLPVVGAITPMPDHKKAKPNKQMFKADGISGLDVPVRQYYELNEGQLRLVWETEIYVKDENNWWVMRIDATTGKEVSRDNYIKHCSFVRCDFEHKHLLEIPAEVPFANAPFAGSVNANKAAMKKQSSVEKQQAIEANTMMNVGSYNHFPLGVESPIHVINGTGDGREIRTTDDYINQATTSSGGLNPSPMGWHDDGTTEYTWTQGNNVLAFYNPDATLVTAPAEQPAIPFVIAPITGNIINADGNVPDGGPNREFHYDATIDNINFNSFLPDAITNLFVWNNIMHDFSYLYGFTEETGNFQANNMGKGEGEETDEDLVFAGAQASGFVNNASFGTPPDGQHGTMSMYIWTTGIVGNQQTIDGDFDAGVIAHEYGHGISTRMVGGGDNNCLGGMEQGGEGWSDYQGLMTTLVDVNGNGTYDEDVEGEGIRGIGNYVTARDAYDQGIRLAPYSTNFDINDFTYGRVPDLTPPHGVGFVWCSILWDMTWALINKYGFEFDVYKIGSDAGNIRAIHAVYEGFKHTACNPSFPDMRDGILTAYEMLYPDDFNNNGDDLLLYKVFARRGLGFSAQDGGIEAFDLPTFSTQKSVDLEQQGKGKAVTYSVSVTNNFNGSISGIEITDKLDDRLSFAGSADGATATGQDVTFPAFDLAKGETKVHSFDAVIDEDTDHTEFLDLQDFEGLPTDYADFVRGGLWQTVSDHTHSGTTAFFHPDEQTTTAGGLQWTTTIPAGANAISFWQRLDTEGSFDGGVFEVRPANGTGFEDLGSRMLKGGYNSAISSNFSGVPFSILDGRRAFSGEEEYFQTIIDLSGYSGTVTFQWLFGTDAFEPKEGWWIDDVQFINLHHVKNEATVSTPQFADALKTDVGPLGTIIREASFTGTNTLAVELVNLKAKALNNDIQVNWTTASEANNEGFELLRRAEGETDFRSIAFIDGAGTTGEATDYQYIDRKVAANVRYYYQLKSIDNNSKTSLSNVVTAIVSNDNNTYVQVYPNPASTMVTLNLFGNELLEAVTVDIIGITGELVRTVQFDNAQDKYQLDFSDLPEQMYALRIKSGDFITTQQVMIQR